MIGRAIGGRGKVRDEAEKPFWISYADLMTALMVLFLVVMSVALLATIKKATEQEQAEARRNADINDCMNALEASISQFPSAKLDRVGRVVNFGDQARFQFNSAVLTDSQKEDLRRFVPKVLELANMTCGKRWLKRVVVEGFTDQQGTYLYNLDLSLRRSQSVLCALFDEDTALTLAQKEAIRSLFLVGGYSFNSAKATPEESRRIELRLEFYGLDEKHLPTPKDDQPAFGICPAR